jgi:hypothetical protein
MRGGVIAGARELNLGWPDRMQRLLPGRRNYRNKQMPTLKVAHLRQQGVDLVIAPLDSDFGHKTRQDQQHIISEIQMRSRSANLAGTVVPVWDGGGGRMSFIAPPNWHPFFRSLNMRGVWANVNKEISW